MPKFPNIPNKDLSHFGYRTEPYFPASVIGGYTDTKLLKQVFGINKAVAMLFVNFELFVIQPAVEAFTRQLKIKIHTKGKRYIDGIVKGCFKSGYRFIDVSKQIHTQARRPGLDGKTAAALLKKYYVEGRTYCVYYTVSFFEKPERDLADLLAKKYTDNSGDASALFDLITSPSQLTAAEKEQDDFLRIRVHSRPKPARVEAMASKHAKKFGWLAIRYFIGKPWTKEDVLQRLRHADKKQAEAQLRNRLRHRQDTNRRLKAWLAKMSSRDQDLVRQIRDIVFLRTQRADFFQESSFYIQPLAEKIAAMFGVPYRDLLNFSPEEIIAALEGRFSLQDHMEARRKMMVTYHGGTNLCLEGNEAKSYVQQRPALRLTAKPRQHLTGVPAFTGCVRGAARIVMKNEDIGKVHKGDILITTMTTPNFIAAMEKAAAFVTNEGGILCHAAIISREMKKPCVIGTKHATRIFKDGDMVEVDANMGIVKKL